MSEKTFNARIVHKHDIEANWLKATNFIPKQGEIIIYDIDDTYNYERFKIGDGSTVISSLPFSDKAVKELLENKVDKVSGKGLSTNDYTTTEKNKLAGIAEGANKTVVDSTLNSTSANPVQNKAVYAAINELNTQLGDGTVAEQISTAIASKANTSDLTAHTGNTSNPHNVTKSQVGLGNVPNVATNDQAPTYSDTTTFDTLTSGEKLSVAFAKIKLAITNLINHIANVSNPHSVTKTQVGLGNVENKSSATIRGELTKENVTNALGYTPPTTNTTYSAAGTSLGLVKSGGDVTISSGTITVNDDSHNHVISNVDGLQTALDAKATASDVTTLQELVGSTAVSTQIANAIASKADVSHEHSAYVNQNAFSNVTVGSTTIAADTATDTLTLVAGSNVTITPDATNDKITIAATDTKYTHPTYTSKFSGLYKITVDGTGHVSATTAVAKSDITALGIPSTNTTYSNATTSAAGLMSATDKSTLDNLSALVGDESVADQIDTATDEFIKGLSVSGKIITYTKGDGSTGTITTQDTNTTYSQATSSALGLVKIGYTESGKNYPVELNSSGQMYVNVPWTDNNTVYTHPTTSGNKHIPSGGSSGQILRWSADGTAVWGADNNTTYSNATTSTAGLMSATDKTTLNNLSTWVGGTSVSEQISTALSGYATTSHTHAASAITAGTLAGNVKAISTNRNTSGGCLRNILVVNSTGATLQSTDRIYMYRE